MIIRRFPKIVRSKTFQAWPRIRVRSATRRITYNNKMAATIGAETNENKCGRCGWLCGVRKSPIDRPSPPPPSSPSSSSFETVDRSFPKKKGRRIHRKNTHFASVFWLIFCCVLFHHRFVNASSSNVSSIRFPKRIYIYTLAFAKNTSSL